MHKYVKTVIAAVKSSKSDGRRRFLRVQLGADESQICSYLDYERTSAQKEVEGSRLDNSSGAMQRIILIEMLLADIRQPVDLAAVCAVQGGGKAVSKSIEEAVEHLSIMGPRLLERVSQP